MPNGDPSGRWNILKNGAGKSSEEQPKNPSLPLLTLCLCQVRGQKERERSSCQASNRSHFPWATASAVTTVGTRVANEWDVCENSNFPYSSTWLFEYSNIFEYVGSSMMWSSKWSMLKQNPLKNGWDINWNRFRLSYSHHQFPVNLFQMISQPFFNGFCFNLDHFEDHIMLEPIYSNIFEYSNNQVDE